MGAKVSDRYVPFKEVIGGIPNNPPCPVVVHGHGFGSLIRAESKTAWVMHEDGVDLYCTSTDLVFLRADTLEGVFALAGQIAERVGDSRQDTLYVGVLELTDWLQKQPWYDGPQGFMKDGTVVAWVSRYTALSDRLCHLLGFTIEDFDVATLEVDPSDQDHPCWWFSTENQSVNICTKPKDPNEHSRHLHVPHLEKDTPCLDVMRHAINVLEAQAEGAK